VGTALLIIISLLDGVDSKKIYSIRRQNNNAKIFICKSTASGYTKKHHHILMIQLTTFQILALWFSSFVCSSLRAGAQGSFAPEDRSSRPWNWMRSVWTGLTTLNRR